MNKVGTLIAIFILSLIFLSGCWDRKELNDRAIWAATGWDVEKKDRLLASGQIVIPSNMQPQGGGGAGNSYFVVSASGKNVEDSLQNLQAKLSRQSFMGQRRVTFFGEEFAKGGIKKYFESIIRSSEVNIRTGAFVVKKGTANEALNLTYPLEKIPSLTALREYEQIGKNGDDTFLSFLIAANSDGIRPILPAVETRKFLDGKQDSPANASIKIAGLAMFDKKLKLIGFLNFKESRIVYWIKGSLKNQIVPILLKEGNASLKLEKLDSKIIPEINDKNQLKMTIKLTGNGALIENNTKLDLLKLENVKFMEKDMEQYVKREVEKTMAKVQTKYGADIFGFGEAVHRKYPQQWKKIKKDWDEKFAEVDVSVKVDLTIKRVGLSGPSLLFKESER